MSGIRLTRLKAGGKGIQEILQVSEKQLLLAFYYFRKQGNSFIILEAENGSYIQAGGRLMTCALEWRSSPQGSHYRAFQNPPVVPWPGVTLQHTGAGLMELQQDEFFRLNQVTEAFLCFFRGVSFPVSIHWRDVTDQIKTTVSGPRPV